MKQNFTVRPFTIRKGALDGIETFLAVARHRNFRRAAAELGVTPSAISQAIRTLEARIGAALFIRTTRSVGLSEAGERFLARAKPAFEELTAAAQAAHNLGTRPAGLLRLTVPRAVVPILLEPLLVSFARAYPEIELEISTNEKLVDLAAEGFDAGVRLGQFLDADMIAVRLSPPFPLIVVGSPDYFKQRTRPKAIEDLRGHACLRLRRTGDTIAPWTFASGNKRIDMAVCGPFIANDLPTLLGAAIRGLGLVQVPAPIAAGLLAAGKLESVLGSFAPMAQGAFLYYPGRRQMLPKLRAFIDHVKAFQGDDGRTRSRKKGA
jgi:DNA-binding transcriptional LysR family regulator